MKRFLIRKKQIPKTFALASKVDKGKSEPKPEESIADRIKLRRGKTAEIEEEEKNIKKKLFKEYFTNYQSPSDMYKKLRETESLRNENQVYLIKLVLNKKRNY